MTRDDAIELANQLTERKAEKILDLKLLYSSVLMDICKRNRFWWRKLDITFSLTQGTTTYDFSKITTTPSIAGIAVEEITVIALILQPPSTNTLINAPELTPIFDAAGFRAMKQNTSQAQPSRYVMGIDDWKTLRVDPPDQTYTAEMTFWAMPMASSTGDISVESNTIPLIPPFYHDAVVNGLEARINKRVWGPKDSRYISAKADYEACILNMTMRPQYTSNFSRQWTSTDDSTQGGAIQSTAPNSAQ